MVSVFSLSNSERGLAHLTIEKHTNVVFPQITPSHLTGACCNLLHSMAIANSPP